MKQLSISNSATRLAPFAVLTLAVASVTAQTLTQGPSSSRTPYLVPAAASGVVRNITSIATATDLVPLTGGSPSQAQEIGGIPDGIGAYDNGDGTVTILNNRELGSALGVIRRHGALGAYVEEILVDKNTLAVISA